MLVKRNMDEMITHFNDVVSAMDISIKDKMTILGMITAIGYESQEAADAIEELSKPRWIPVTERLPKYGERVLVFGGVTMYVAYYDKNRYGGESWHKLNSKSHYCNPTHWMPLPRPPKEG